MGKIPEHPWKKSGAAASVVYVYNPRARGWRQDPQDLLVSLGEAVSYRFSENHLKQ